MAVEAEITGLREAELVDLTINGDSNVLNLRITVRTSSQPTYQQVLAMQAAIAGRLQRTVALKLILVPTTSLDPLIPPTATPTSTPGPSSTPTPTFTPTMTSTPQATATATTTATFTPSPTATPMSAIIFFTSGKGVAMRDAPNGAVITYLSDGTPISILTGRQWVKGLQWVQVRDAKQRTGWVLGQFVSIRP